MTEQGELKLLRIKLKELKGNLNDCVCVSWRNSPITDLKIKGYNVDLAERIKKNLQKLILGCSVK